MHADIGMFTSVLTFWLLLLLLLLPHLFIFNGKKKSGVLPWEIDSSQGSGTHFETSAFKTLHQSNCCFPLSAVR